MLLVVMQRCNTPWSGCPGGPNILECVDAADTNDDGSVHIADAIFLLSVLFPGPGGAMTLPDPNGVCGGDPTMDGIDCANYPPCP